MVETVTWFRAWAMPSHETFDCPPIKALVERYVALSAISIDAFARNKRIATFTNDIDPTTKAEFHMDALKFLQMLQGKNVIPDLVLLDPPYSPRQISEHYRRIGLKASQADTQNVRRRAERECIAAMQVAGGVVISFGWNSTGMGKKLGYELVEGLLVNHGAAHNDTICVVEQKTKTG